MCMLNIYDFLIWLNLNRIVFYISKMWKSCAHHESTHIHVVSLVYYVVSAYQSSKDWFWGENKKKRKQYFPWYLFWFVHLPNCTTGRMIDSILLNIRPIIDMAYTEVHHEVTHSNVNVVEVILIQGVNILLNADEHCFGRVAEDPCFQIEGTSISANHCKIYRKKAEDAELTSTSISFFLKDTRLSITYKLIIRSFLNFLFIIWFDDCHWVVRYDCLRVFGLLSFLQHQWHFS